MSEGQVDLFKKARRITRKSDPLSSLEAGVRLILSGQQGTQMARVLLALETFESWVYASTVARRAEMEPYVVRKRLPELERLGKAERGRVVGREQVWRAVR